MKDTVFRLCKTGLKVAAYLYLLDRFVLPNNKVKLSKDGLEQPMLLLSETSENLLLDPETGKLQQQGWHVNGETLVTDNSAGVSKALWNPSLALAKVREVNIFFIQTPDHYIQVLSPIRAGTINIMASVSVIGVNPGRLDEYLVEDKQEENLVEVTEDYLGTQISVDTQKLRFDFRRETEAGKESRITVDSKQVPLKFDATFDGKHESMYWVQPLTEDKHTEFVSWKRAGIPLEAFTYTYKGQEYSCQSNECYMTTDMYRGHHNYGMQYYFGLVQGVSEQGDSFGLVLQEGIGTNYKSLDRASEDHISINGQVFKLDKTKFDLTDSEPGDLLGSIKH